MKHYPRNLRAVARRQRAQARTRRIAAKRSCADPHMSPDALELVALEQQCSELRKRGDFLPLHACRYEKAKKLALEALHSCAGDNGARSIDEIFDDVTGFEIITEEMSSVLIEEAVRTMRGREDLIGLIGFILSIRNGGDVLELFQGGSNDLR